jgi:hypothetical protein
MIMSLKKISSEIYRQRVAAKEIKPSGRNKMPLNKKRSTIPTSVSNQYLINLAKTKYDSQNDEVLLEVGKTMFYKINYELE